MSARVWIRLSNALAEHGDPESDHESAHQAGRDDHHRVGVDGCGRHLGLADDLAGIDDGTDQRRKLRVVGGQLVAEVLPASHEERPVGVVPRRGHAGDRHAGVLDLLLDLLDLALQAGDVGVEGLLGGRLTLLEVGLAEGRCAVLGVGGRSGLERDRQHGRVRRHRDGHAPGQLHGLLVGRQQLARPRRDRLGLDQLRLGVQVDGVAGAGTDGGLRRPGRLDQELRGGDVGLLRNAQVAPATGSGRPGRWQPPRSSVGAPARRSPPGPGRVRLSVQP